MSQDTENQVSVVRDHMTAVTNNYTTEGSLDPLFEDTEDRYWGLSDRDVPILIGAAAGESRMPQIHENDDCFDSCLVPNSKGAMGLVFLILGAIVIWYCCQFAFKSEKSVYSKYASWLPLI